MTSVSGDPAPVAVVGTGLIGTSIAMAALRVGDRAKGFDSDRSVLRGAASRSELTPSASIAQCVGGARFVFVCTPVDSIGRVVAQCMEAEPKAIVTDVGSVKRKVLAEVEVGVPEDHRSRFVGGHPMTGSERTGPEAASASLLEGAAWVLTPASWSAPEAVTELQDYLTGLGAHSMTMDAGQHDRLVALVSHLPQLVSSALMSLVSGGEVDDPTALALAAAGFRDVTRLAGSDPGLWAGILDANREGVVEALDIFLERLTTFRSLVQGRETVDLRRMLTKAHDARTALGAKPRVRAGMALVQIPVPDRPGVLARLTAALGGAGVNIEDLQIVHSPWEPAGVIHLTVLAESADPAIAVLETGGFQPVRVA